MKRLLLPASALALALRSISLSPPAFASPSPAPEPIPVDRLQERVFKTSRSQQARTIGKAYGALREGKLGRARDLARPLQEHEQFGDYATWITATALEKEAESQLARKQYGAAHASARRALPLFARLQAEFPYSPLRKRVDEDIVAAGLLSADAQASQGQWRGALRAYERAFQGIDSERGLASLPVTTLELFAKACSKRPTPTCGAWTVRFAGLYPKDWAKLSARAAPKEPAGGRLPPLPKLTRITAVDYKAPDPDNVSFGEAMEKYSKKDYGDAAEAFGKLLEGFPLSEHRYRARYWLGRALKADGKDEDAKKTFEALLKDSPLTYYGLLASFETGIDVETAIAGTLPSVTQADPYLRPEEVFRVRRAEQFLAEAAGGTADARDLAAKELDGLRPRDALSPEFLMYLATLDFEAGNHAASFVVLSELIARGYPGTFTSHGLRLIFPAEFQPLIDKHAKESGLDPILVMSLIKQESAFAHGAKSGAGARGLMQLMPATARDMDPAVLPADLTEADRNLRIGMKYLSLLLKRFDGNVPFALAGYNAGPNAVARWVSEGRAKDGMLEFIENIPYAETRGYVGSILRNYFWYTKRIKGETFKAWETFWVVPGGTKPSDAKTDAT